MHTLVVMTFSVRETYSFVMKFFDQTLPTIAENLAFDEALLEMAEQTSGIDLEALRIWEFPSDAIILGRATRIAEEVDISKTELAGIPVARRCSGGATVMIGPGCLLYSVLLSTNLRPELHSSIDAIHHCVTKAMLNAFGPIVGSSLAVDGVCDLLFDGKKFSGNALRVKRSHVLYHGTILYAYPLEKITSFLLEPKRRPEYRGDKTHRQFITNLPLARDTIRDLICRSWPVERWTTQPPQQQINELLQKRYALDAWHRSR